MSAYLSLGSNIGDRGFHLKEAVRKLQEHPEITVSAQSSVYETEPWGLTEQAEFWNQVIEVETSLEPRELLKVCQAIENELGRKRIIHWGPRTIDIDLLLYDNRVNNDQELILPHPRMEERNFVLIPLKEIAPELILPSGNLIKNVSGEGKVTSVTN